MERVTTILARVIIALMNEAIEDERERREREVLQRSAIRRRRRGAKTFCLKLWIFGCQRQLVDRMFEFEINKE